MLTTSEHEVFTIMLAKPQIFWDTALCWLVTNTFDCIDHKNGGRKLLQTISNIKTMNTALYPRRL